MDFQAFVDTFETMTCVVSIENLGDGKYGTLRIVTGNESYTHSVEVIDDLEGKDKPVVRRPFIPNSVYTDYITRDLNFEDSVYRAAVNKKCVHAYVKPDRFDVWLNMIFMPLSYEEGNLCYCTYSMEISSEQDSSLMSNVKVENAAAVLDTCIKLRGTSDFRTTIKEVVDDIRSLCKADFCCILLMDEFKRTCELLCEAKREGSILTTMNDYLDENFYNIAESWESTIGGSNCLIIKNEQEMEFVKERNPIWYASLYRANVNSIVLFPLKSQGQLLGYIWAVNFAPERAPDIKETLELTTFILASEIGNFLLVDRLKVLSSRDMLTGVLNRNEMNNLVDWLCKRKKSQDKSVGVVFADLNGLKIINDTEGHSAGDALLRSAAAILREVFAEEEVFRAGGDEFAIIVTDTTEDAIAVKVQKVRDLCLNYENIVFAMGFDVQENSSDVRTALRVADERMYDDKRKYYEAHPEKKRGAHKDAFYYQVENKK